MKIKFLSIIASFFMVSFLITSCLNDENSVEYSPDATIHAFGLDTIGYGVNYKFTIDQINGLIYNEDSLPVHADTIIDRILIKTLTTSSGIVTMKSKDNKDSIININDSIDLRKYVNTSSKDNQLKVLSWAPDMKTSKPYSISIRKHKHDPDSLAWKYMGGIDNAMTAKQKSIILGNDIVTYTVIGSDLKVYKTALNNGTSSGSTTATGITTLPTSIINFNGTLYATVGNGKVYSSANGSSWLEATAFGTSVDLLLAPFKDQITYTVNSEANERRFYTLTGAISTSGAIVPTEFPIENISYTPYKTSTNQNALLLVGKPKVPTTIGDGDKAKETTVIWGYEGDGWNILPPNNTDSYCPAFENPSIMYYNNQYYVFGENFASFYTSQNVLAWKKANAKFSFPYYTEWDKTPPYTPTKTPEFRGRKIFSIVLDPKTAYIWVIFSKGTAVFKETVKKSEKIRATEEKERTYSYDTEVWRGRLNQLWFDIANNKYTPINN